MSRAHIETIDNSSAHQALAQAITNSRLGRSAPLREQRSGKLDRRRIARVGVGDIRVFTRKSAPAPQKVRVTILLDASSSMLASSRTGQTTPQGYAIWGPSNAQVCAQVGRDLAGATELLPWVTADVVAFTTTVTDVALYGLWQSGRPTSDMDSYGRIDMQGTEEGYAIAYALDELREKLNPREQGLIIIVSDGGPGEPGHVKAVVQMARDLKVPVVSVAVTKSAQQPLMYGGENVVTYDGNTRKLARDMARVIGRVL